MKRHKSDPSRSGIQDVWRPIWLLVLGILITVGVLSWDVLASGIPDWTEGTIAWYDVWAPESFVVHRDDGSEWKAFGRRELVIAEGTRVGPLQAAALKALRGKGVGFDYSRLGGNVLFVLVTLSLIVAFIMEDESRIVQDKAKVSLLLAIFFATLWIVRGLLQSVVTPADPETFYLFNPIPVSVILAAVFINVEVAVIIDILLSVVAGYMVPAQGFVFTAYALVGGLTGVFCVSPRRSDRKDIMKAGFAVAMVNAVLTLTFVLAREGAFPQTFFREFFKSTVAGFLNGFMCSLIVLGLVPFLERFFRVTTSTQLQELIHPSSPLLQKLIKEAPGTYHHSANVANLAEAAAREVGADSVLCKSAAYYHDIGKIKRPYFFVENQFGGFNYHDNLSPNLSKLIITSHTKDGVEMARKANLPRAVVDVIGQHHGTDLVAYFYHGAKASQDDKETVEEHTFRYPGPKPQTREAAIVMIADGVEAAARSLVKPTPTAIDKLVSKIINDKFVDGQFNECDLTKKDFERIAASLAKTLASMHHSRIAYPEDLEGMEPVSGTREEALRESSVAGEAVTEPKEEASHGASVG